MNYMDRITQEQNIKDENWCLSLKKSSWGNLRLNVRGKDMNKKGVKVPEYAIDFQQHQKPTNGKIFLHSGKLKRE